jgi:hypothetical protein
MRSSCTTSASSESSSVTARVDLSAARIFAQRRIFRKLGILYISGTKPSFLIKLPADD